MACVIREGDPTTTGGTVVAGSSRYIAEHRQAARISDPVWCPACKSMGFIAEGNPTFIDEYLEWPAPDTRCAAPARSAATG